MTLVNVKAWCGVVGLRVLAASCVILFLLRSEPVAQQQTSMRADTMVIRAKVYKVNEKQPWAEALAIRGNKIVAVGSDREIERYRDSSTRVIDAGGRLVLPGFEDCHIHFMDGSLGLV